MKTKSILVFFLIVVYFLGLSSCNNEGSSRFYIGETGPSGIGIVFYVTDGGIHGMEVAPSDQDFGNEWISGELTQTTLNDKTSTEIGSGLANCNAIVAQEGNTGSAAQICRNYRKDQEGDWFLPSINELKAIWSNLVADENGDFSSVYSIEDGRYWSSSENNSNAAWCLYFYYGAMDSQTKSSTFRIRAVRSF